MQVKSKISVLNRDFCFAHTSKAASLRITRVFSCYRNFATELWSLAENRARKLGRSKGLFQFSNFKFQVSRIVNFELWIVNFELPTSLEPYPLLSPCYPLAIPLLSSYYPLAIVAQNNIQTNGSDIQIFKFVNYCRFIIKKYKTVLSKKKRFL